jgi:hypothetical protein
VNPTTARSFKEIQTATNSMFYIIGINDRFGEFTPWTPPTTGRSSGHPCPHRLGANPGDKPVWPTA